MVAKGINHVGIAVTDIEKTTRFFTEVLGLSINRQYYIQERNLKIVFLKVGEQEIELLQYDQVKPSMQEERGLHVQGVNHVAIEVDDIRAYLPKLKEYGVEFIDKEPRVVFGGPQILDFWGPDNIIIELYQEG